MRLMRFVWRENFQRQRLATEVLLDAAIVRR
jgi:hypothetical protein